MPAIDRLHSKGNGLRKFHLVIMLAWLLVNGFFLVKNGIVTTGEAGKYIDESNIFLQTGKLTATSMWMYFSQIFLLSFSTKLHLGFAFVVAIQLAVNLVATFYFWKTLLAIFNSPFTALAGTLILLLNQPYQEFNTFLQTESLFYSLTLILSCYLLLLEKVTLKNFAAVVLLLIIISVTRPTGLLFIPPVFLYLFLVSLRETSLFKKIGILGGFVLLFFFIINKAMESGGEFDFMLPFRNEDIICGLPSLKHSVAINSTENSNSVIGLVYYIIHNFSQFARLAYLKTIAFFGLYRTYYSRGHNIYLIIYFYSIHIMAIASLTYWIKNFFYKSIYLCSLILIIWLTVMLTCDDWHNRFYLSISPYIIMLSMGIIKKITSKESNFIS